MTKRQLIDEILSMNQTAEAGFLARFQEEDLGDYLAHLKLSRTPRLTGDASRYEQYFEPQIEAVETATAVMDPPAEEEFTSEQAEPAVLTEDENYIESEIAETTPVADAEPEEVNETQEMPAEEPIAMAESSSVTDDSVADGYDIVAEMVEQDVAEYDSDMEPVSSPETELVTVSAQRVEEDSSFAEDEQQTESWLF